MKTPYSEESELETPRSVRGLKHLTALVKKIICKHQPTSFKNVASRLIDELIDNEGPERVKEEKNVRRRVYDAINVLIAADAVNRNGKYVNWKDNWDGFEIDSRKSEVEKRRKRVEEKKTALQNAINKLLAIKFLIHRNKKNKGLTPAVQFPFVVLSTPDVQKNTMSIKVNQNATFLQIKLAKPINLFGDMEILLALKMHKMKLANLVMFLPSKELLSYCSFNEF
jgi:transcription factor Dp-1